MSEDKYPATRNVPRELRDWLDGLRFWLIRKLAGKCPVMLNLSVCIPEGLCKPAMYFRSGHNTCIDIPVLAVDTKIFEESAAGVVSDLEPDITVGIDSFHLHDPEDLR